MTALVLTAVGAVFIALRRPLGRLLLEWRNLLRPALRNPRTRAGEVMVTLLGAFFVVLSIVALIWS